MRVRNLVFSCLLLQISVASMAADQWVSLFNDNNFDGWHIRPGGTWTIADGVIHGVSPATEKRHGLLVSDQHYENFEVKLQFRVHSGDSGFYFRIEENDSVVSCKGFQVEVDSSLETGGLYETLGRQWVVKPDEDKHLGDYEPGQWTDLHLIANEGNVVVKLNGVTTATLTDDPGRREGPFALQLHGSMEMDVEFKDIMVLVRD